MPRLPSLRRIVRAGFLGSNFTALNPWPVMRLSDDPTLTLSQYLNDRYFLPASSSASSCSGGVEQPAQRGPHRHGSHLRGRVARHHAARSSRIPIKIIRSRDWGTPKYMAFISLAETL